MANFTKPSSELGDSSRTCQPEKPEPVGTLVDEIAESTLTPA